MKYFILSLLLVGLSATEARSQMRQISEEQTKSELEKQREKEERLNDPVPDEFQFIGFSFFRTTTSNVTPTNEVIQGQVIGRMFGPNSTETVDRTAVFTEQRFVPLFIYQPAILDGVATFRSMFKIDYTWGDTAYGIGNNRGGGLSGGQVNLQTLMANVDLRPQDSWWNLVLGMQRIFDGPYDPNVNTLEHFQTTGNKLSYWGTQAVGASWFGRPHQAIHARLGFFQLWENQVSRDQDVFITMADIVTLPTPKLELGFNLWYLRDTAKGAGGISVLSQGITSQLAAYNGATRVTFPGSNQRYTADIFWVGTNVNYNRNFTQGPLQFDAYVNTNLGSIDPDNPALGNVNVLGTAFNSSLAYQYGKTAKDKVWFEVMTTSGDGNGAQDGELNSVLTGNVWGSPVGIWGAHRSFLLFPDPQVVSRYYSMVHDISNMGLGFTGGTINFMKDVIPFKFNAKVGAALAYSNFTLPDGGNHIGTEFNAELKYNLKVFLTVGLSAAYVVTGDFYNAPNATEQSLRPDNSWVSFVTLSWLMFN